LHLVFSAGRDDSGPTCEILRGRSVSPTRRQSNWKFLIPEKEGKIRLRRPRECLPDDIVKASVCRHEVQAPVENSIHPELDSFSLVKGGPLYQSMVRMRLVIGDSYIPMAIVFVVLTWLPLLILSVWQGSATGTDVQIPFLRDYAVHARFLISLPILILAEGLLDSKLRKTIRQFTTLNLITPEDTPRFNSAIRDVHVWRDSALAEALIAIVVVIQSYFVLSKHGWFSATMSSWHTIPSLVGGTLTTAGWWLEASLSIQIFLQARWLWRLLIWTKFLARINRLNLRLIPTHPDRARGSCVFGWRSNTVRVDRLSGFCGRRRSRRQFDCF
jgi:hypothetical protein